MSSKYKGFFESSLKKESQSKEREFSFDEKHRLPKDLKSRDSIEKGFRDYLNNKQDHEEETFERRSISPPFEVSRVPSPFYGYKERPKGIKQTINYHKLKKDMYKKSDDFILFESEFTKEQVKPTIKKGYGLHRTLASIIEEEKSGNNVDKSEVPGLFLPNKKQ